MKAHSVELGNSEDFPQWGRLLHLLIATSETPHKCEAEEAMGVMSMTTAPGLEPHLAAEKAVSVIGLGYDLCKDIRFSSCKTDPSRTSLLHIDHNHTRDLLFPGGVVVPNVPISIQCDKGERTRFRSDFLPFNQMSELFNNEVGLSGKIPSGQFNMMFDMKNCWPKDAASTKALALDGWFITLYNVELNRTHIAVSDQVKNEVPSSWNPSALAEFIANYGTHVVVGVKMGGKDVVHMKQLKNSDLEATEVQKLLKQLADERFSEEQTNQTSNVNPAEIPPKLKEDHARSWGFRKSFPLAGMPSIKSHSKNDDILSISVRRGGIDTGQSFNQWLSTISQSPNVISMSFVPITSLLNSVPGNGFLSHAVNLYLRYKPPIEELHQFLEFQLPRLWAPMYGDLPLGFGPRQRRNASPSLQFSLMGPKLFVNTTKVDSRNRPVTGIRLYLEGKKNDHLGIHLQHLSDLPGMLEIISDQQSYNPRDESVDKAYYEPVKWSMFSHVCTAPVQYNNASQLDESTPIVTKAWFEVKLMGMKKVLFLRLGFSSVASARMRRSEWDGPSTGSRKSGFFSALMSARLSKELLQNNNAPEKATKVNINSAVYEGAPPVPTREMKMLMFVDTKEMVRGPEDTPGYWVVTGAKLCVEGGRISVKAKYSLLIISDEQE